MATPTPTNQTDEITHQFRFFRVFKSGKLELFFPTWGKVPASDDPITGVQSKDVIISSDPPVSARIFVPKPNPNNQKLPILVYVHGGGFCMQSAFSPQYHEFCKTVAADAEAIVVSVEYGLFPARPIPACYEDSWAVLQWVADHVKGSGPEKWLNEHGDFGRVFVGGDSAGGNMSHTLAFRAGSVGLPEGFHLVGAIMVHPFFGGTEDDHMWLYMYPGNEKGMDHDPMMNPPLEDLRRLGCDKVLIFVAEKDHLNAVGKKYYEKLKKSGWEGSVEIVENEKEEHCFHLRDPSKDDASKLKDKFVSFIKNY